MLIKSKFSGGRCKQCRKIIQRNEVVEWTKGIKGVKCSTCYNASTIPVDTPSAESVVTEKPSFTSPVVNESLVEQFAKVSNDNGVESYKFNSMQSWIEFLKTPLPSYTNNPSSTDTKRSYDWTFGVNFDQAMQMLESGYKEGYDKASKLVDKIFADVSGAMETKELVYDVEGTEIDMATYLQGIPECMTSEVNHMIINAAYPQLIDLYFHTGTSAVIDAESMLNKGIRAMALVELLELSGFRVRVTLMRLLQDDKKRKYQITVPVKEYHESLNRYNLAFLLCHPAVNRRLIFGTLERLPRDTVNAIVHYSVYGLSIGDTAMNAGLPESAIYFPPLVRSTWTQSDIAEIEKQIVEELKRQGIRFKTGILTY